jgi:perosamine synthetase
MDKISHGSPSISTDDIKAVIEVLKTNWLTTGPVVKKFEDAFAKHVGSKHAVAVSSGTAALHLAYLVAGLKNKDELITTPITFPATANAALYCNARVVLADIKKDMSGLIDSGDVQNKITKKTKILAPVHYAGMPADMISIKRIAEKHNIIVVEDACQALGSTYKNTTIGDCRNSLLRSVLVTPNSFR